jgi:roadblock/LC7 domain-containing protein
MLLRGGHHDVRLDGICRGLCQPWGFDTTSWLPAMGWTFSGGDYSIVVHGDQFVIAETEKVKSFDELRRLLREGKA